jgi:hypothetical protein
VTRVDGKSAAVRRKLALRSAAWTTRVHLRPVTLREANAHIAQHHAHHPPVRGCKFCIGAVDGNGVLRGVVVVERPKARMLDDGYTLELTRVCTDRTPHVASMMIASATRASFAMGARRVISYILNTELGISYLAAGWRRAEDDQGEPIACGGGEWSRPSRPREAMRSPTCTKYRWEKEA